jgi:hypothetical protein
LVFKNRPIQDWQPLSDSRSCDDATGTNQTPNTEYQVPNTALAASWPLRHANFPLFHESAITLHRYGAFSPQQKALISVFVEDFTQRGQQMSEKLSQQLHAGSSA